MKRNKRADLLFLSFFLSYIKERSVVHCVRSELKHALITSCNTTHPEGKLLSQHIAASAVRLCSARFCILHDHPARQACRHRQEHNDEDL